jgi:hypothetical protein
VILICVVAVVVVVRRVVLVVVVIVEAKLTIDLTTASHHFVSVADRRVRHGFFRLDAPNSIAA